MSRSTFRVLFYLKRNAPKKNGLVPVMCRITVNGKISQFSCKLNEEDDPKRTNDDPKVFQSVPTDEEKLLEVIKGTPSISRAELSKRLKISERQVRKITDQLREKGVLIREGGNSGKWVVNKISLEK